MDNQHLTYESIPDVDIKEELVESDDETPWNIDTECSVEESAIKRQRLNSSNEEESCMDEEELQSPETIFVQMGYETEESNSEEEMDPLAQDDENLIGDVAEEKKTKKGNSSYGGGQRPAPGGGSAGSVWVCKACHSPCDSFKHLVEHSRVHAGEQPPVKQPLECEACGKRFAGRSTLNLHRARVHSRAAAERPYECLTCGKRFGHVSYLRTHALTHTDQRQKCDTCGKHFANRHSLATHMRAHRGDYVYGCTLCNKGFTCKSQYDYHMRKHSGEKPFACAACDEKFAAKVSLARHFQAHHAAPPPPPPPPAAEGKEKGQADEDSD